METLQVQSKLSKSNTCMRGDKEKISGSKKQQNLNVIVKHVQ